MPPKAEHRPAWAGFHRRVRALESGAYAAWYAMRPNDTPKRTRQVLVDAATTFTARK